MLDLIWNIYVSSNNFTFDQSHDLQIILYKSSSEQDSTGAEAFKGGSEFRS